MRWPICKAWVSRMVILIQLSLWPMGRPVPCHMAEADHSPSMGACDMQRSVVIVETLMRLMCCAPAPPPPPGGSFSSLC